MKMVGSREIAKTTIQLLLDEPFYGHLLANLPKAFTTDIQSLGLKISKNYQYNLLINPIYWQTFSDSQKIGLIKHELLHLIFDHPLQIVGFSDKRLFYIATDLIINQYLLPEQIESGAFTLATVFKEDIARHKSTSFYYNLLKDKLDLAQIPKDNYQLQKHQFWGITPSSINEVKKKIVAGQKQYAVKNALKQISLKEVQYLSTPLIQYLDKIYQPNPKLLNWRRILRFFVNNSLRTRIQNTLHHPSKRYGTYPGTKIKNQRKILIAIDTSASLEASEFHQFFNEIHQIWKQGSDLTIVECDTIIHKTYTYRGQKPEFISGRGGTFFDLPIIYANETLKPDGIIYFTDGEGPPPKIKNRIPILWVISKNGINKDQWPWNKLSGKKVKLQAP